ncbi:MAG TPA: glycosyltransferase family 4 protein [Candidatus Paceibacterota bacterium]|nr:glycosyltransferase family 4 protein [Candidatus Paceibacterota bacterium]
MVTEKEKLKICFFGNAASIHTIKWVSYFSKRGHEVHLISYEPPQNPEINNLNLYLIGKKLPIKLWRINTLVNLPLAFIQAKRIIKKINPDIVNAHYVTSYGHLAALVGFHPLVITAWGSDILITPKESSIARLVVKYVLKRADLITCDAEHMKKAIIDWGANPLKIKIIYFGVDTQKFSPGEGENELKRELGVSGFKTVISLRSLEPVYNIESLIKAVPFVLKEAPTTKFIIVGKGTYEKELKALVSEMKLENDVKFLGFILNEELPRYLRAADIYVSTSLSDGGIAASTAEAMSCGLPVIITDFGENRNWVNDRINGLIIPAKSPKILAKKIILLLKNKELREEFGKRGRETIEEKNNYYKEMEKVEKLYVEIIKNNKKNIG